MIDALKWKSNSFQKFIINQILVKLLLLSKRHNLSIVEYLFLTLRMYL